MLSTCNQVVLGLNALGAVSIFDQYFLKLFLENILSSNAPVDIATALIIFS